MIKHKWHEEGTEGMYVSQTDGWDTVEDWNNEKKGNAQNVLDSDLGSSQYPFKTISAMIIYTEIRVKSGISVIHGTEFKENMPIRTRNIDFVGNTVIKLFNTANYQFSIRTTYHLHNGESITNAIIHNELVFLVYDNIFFRNVIINGLFRMAGAMSLYDTIFKEITIESFFKFRQVERVSFIRTTFNSYIKTTDTVKSVLLCDCNLKGGIDEFNNQKVHVYNTTIDGSITNCSVEELPNSPELNNDGFLPYDSPLLRGEFGHIGARMGAKSYSGAELLPNAILKNLTFNTENRSLEIPQLNVAPQAATATTIQLNSIASGDLTGLTIEVLSGKGAGQYRTITAYDIATKTATVANWDVIPDATTLYALSAYYEKMYDMKAQGSLGQISVDCPYVPYITLATGASLDELTEYRIRNGSHASHLNEVGNADISHEDSSKLTEISNARFVKVSFEVLTPNQKY